MRGKPKAREYLKEVPRSLYTPSRKKDEKELGRP